MNHFNICKTAPYSEELGEGARDSSKVGVDLHQAAQPAGELPLGAWGLKALVTHDDGSIVLLVPDDPPHSLVHCPERKHCPFRHMVKANVSMANCSSSAQQAQLPVQ